MTLTQANEWRPHETPLIVRFGELDPYNHVNHAVYVAWFEAGRTQALSDLGIPLHVMSERGCQMVVTDLQVKFRLPARAGDHVVVQTWLSELGAVRSTWSQRIVRRTVGEQHVAEQHVGEHHVGEQFAAGEVLREDVLCEAEVRAGSTDTKSRPRRLDPEMKELLQRLAKPAAE
jgi:acyl-CoA thioester hydrolase